MSSDLNPRYLDCWPLARRAWKEIAGLAPVLVLVADDGDVPSELREDANVHVFPPIDGVHTALQAQCIRLLFPALLDDAGGVLTSDVDMVPLNRSYFHRPAGRIDERHFLAYRDVLLWGSEIPICYNAAHPRTWGETFRIADADDVRARLREWGSGLRYDAVRGGHGWDTDQVVLYTALLERGRRMRDVWILDDRFANHYRLDHALLGLNVPEGSIRRRLERGVYSDYHFRHPFAEYAELNRSVVELAIDGADAVSRRRVKAP